MDFPKKSLKDFSDFLKSFNGIPQGHLQVNNLFPVGFHGLTEGLPEGFEGTFIKDVMDLLKGPP